MTVPIIIVFINITRVKADYYGVNVFIHFDFPIIGGFFEIPIYGETRILFEKSEVQG